MFEGLLEGHAIAPRANAWRHRSPGERLEAPPPACHHTKLDREGTDNQKRREEEEEEGGERRREAEEEKEAEGRGRKEEGGGEGRREEGGNRTTGTTLPFSFGLAKG